MAQVNRGFNNASKGSLLGQLDHMSPEIKKRYYKNRRDYYTEYSLLNRWFSRGCVADQMVGGFDNLRNLETQELDRRKDAETDSPSDP